MREPRKSLHRGLMNGIGLLQSRTGPIGDPRDDDAVEWLIEALPRRCGWIRKVVALEKVYPDRLRVSLDLREPVALLEGAGGDLHFVDGQGVVVAPVEEAPEIVRRRRPPLIDRPGRALALGPGKCIEDGVLLDGLAVVNDLQPHLADLQARGVEIALVDLTPMVRRAAGDLSEVNLYTSAGVRIEWGRAPSSGLAELEPDPAAKVANILWAVAKYPGLRGVEAIRAQFHSPRQATVVEQVIPDSPLAATP